jgi:hypothetical protein
MKKFDVKAAVDGLEKYLRFRERHVNWCCDLDVDDPRLSELISSGYLFVSPNRDNEGRRVLITDAGKQSI